MKRGRLEAPRGEHLVLQRSQSLTSAILGSLGYEVLEDRVALPVSWAYWPR